MKFAATLIAIALSPVFVACDSATEQNAGFRNGPSTLYLSQYDAEISVFDFAEMVLMCPAKPKLAVTYTRWPIPDSGLDQQVIGLGFSVTADSEWSDCYEDLMLSMGAHPLP